MYVCMYVFMYLSIYLYISIFLSIYLSTYFQVSFADLWNSAFNLPIMAVRFLSRYSLNNLLCSIRVKSMNTLFCAISMLNNWEQWALQLSIIISQLRPLFIKKVSKGWTTHVVNVFVQGVQGKFCFSPDF